MEVRRNNSKKRTAILNALRDTTSHPTAEMLYNELKEADSSLGIATVYRNLSILLEEGEIITVGKVNGQERYDADTHTHGHFVCSKCGHVFDFELSPDHLDEQFSMPGFTVSGYELRLIGQCSQCAGCAKS